MLSANLVEQYASMLPRAVFDHKAADKSGKVTRLDKQIEILSQPGVYILYRDDVPYYIGQAERLRSRLYTHARMPGSPRYLFWNFFSVFVVRDAEQRAELEGLLIAAFPTANGAKPKLQKHRLEPGIQRSLQAIRPMKVLGARRASRAQNP